jgi:peroxiredoxin
VTPVDDILSPVDSAVIKNGRFSFELTDTVPVVRFISSQRVIDGNFVVVEPGVLNVDFTGEEFVGGTPANERLKRFMAEKEKIVNLRKMCEPENIALLDIDEAMCDSIKEVVFFAGEIFEAYALNEIVENIETPVGLFYLLQSVGVVAPAKLLPVFEKVPSEYRDKLYDTIKNRVEANIRESAMAEKYVEEVYRSLEETAVGKRFQNFELDNINGGKVLLSDEVFANRYTLVLFWASWEDNAKNVLRSFSEMYDKYKACGLQIVGVSLDGSVAGCKSVVDELSVNWVQLCNPNGGSAEVAAAYGITDLPAAILVNNRGTIIARMSTADEVLKKFNELF